MRVAARWLCGKCLLANGLETSGSKLPVKVAHRCRRKLLAHKGASEGISGALMEEEAPNGYVNPIDVTKTLRVFDALNRDDDIGVASRCIK
jgi:hypothetical protein